jgi:4-amino-4-deoxychorismate lyase
VLGTGVVDPSTPVARADDAGLIRGDGCFEGCRLRRDADGRVSIDKLDAHLARMTRSAAALAIDFDEPAWRALIAEALRAWTGADEAAVKLLLSRGSAAAGVPSGFVWIAELGPDHDRWRQDGISVVTLRRGISATAFADAPWLLGGVKTLSYAINMAAAREAERRGVDDVVFTSDHGVVLESPTSTVVWATGTDGERAILHTTPTGATGILGGTTQQLLYERAADAGWRTTFTLATVDDLHAADAVWLISSVRGPVEVVELDGKARVRMPALDAEVRRLCGF